MAGFFERRTDKAEVARFNREILLVTLTPSIKSVTLSIKVLTKPRHLSINVETLMKQARRIRRKKCKKCSGQGTVRAGTSQSLYTCDLCGGK